MNPKDIIDYLTSFWPNRKTKWGLFVGVILIGLSWFKYDLPYYQTHEQLFYAITLIYFTGPLVLWLSHSGRIILPSSKYTVVFCLKGHDARSVKYIQSTLSILNRELDKLKLVERFRFITIGNDIIRKREEAHNYRGKHNVDLVIWGEIFSGSKEEKEVSDFKSLSFTYKLPEPISRANLIDLFSADINIALVNRDWNIYEVNSLPDTEKISGHLSEVILFIIGIIYVQYREFAEDSVAILENLFKLLESQTKGEHPKIDHTENILHLSPQMFRKGRVLAILLNVYKNLGLHFVDHHDYRKGRFYLEKFRAYEKNDIVALSSLALSAFYLKDMDAARMYTNEIVDKKNQIYLFNKAFFGIYDKNYASALFYYKEILKIKGAVTGDIVTKVISFLDERKSEHPNELAYNFAIGFVNYYFCQKHIGNSELRKFFKLAKKRIEYHEMICFVENSIFPKDKRKKL